MTEIQAVLCGYYGKGNGGDEALLVSMLEMLPPTGEAASIVGQSSCYF